MLLSMMAPWPNAIAHRPHWRILYRAWLALLILILVTPSSHSKAAEKGRAVTVYRLLVETEAPLAPGSEYPFRVLSPESLTAAERFLAMPIGKNELLTTYDAAGLPTTYDYFVVINGKMQQASLACADPWINLALLSLSEPHANPMELNRTATLNIGEPLLAAPRDAATEQLSRSKYQVSATSLKPPFRTSETTTIQTAHDFGGFIGVEGETTLPPGMPLLNHSDQVAAIATGVVSEKRSLCIPIDSTCSAAMEALLRHSPLQYGYMGLEPGNLKDLPGGQSRRGVYVRQVMQHAPAAQAGLREENPRTGDVDVIAEVNGVAMETPDNFLLAIGRQPFESIVKLTIRRGKIGGEMETIPVEVKLAKRYSPPERPFFPAIQTPPWRGISIDYFTAIDEYAARARLVDPEGCVAIVAVATDTAAWKAGLRPGQFLTHIGEMRIKNEKEFVQATHDLKEPVKVTTTARSDGIRLEPQVYELTP